jgi:alpha-tubulin suppressor-like RCC1 family protein
MNDSLKKLILHELANYDEKEEFLRSIKKLYIFDNVNDRSPFNINGKNFFVINKNDDVFAFGKNGLGCLGLKHCAPVSEPQPIPGLSRKKVLSFSNGFYHVIARNEDNKIYCWGYNNYGQVGNGKYESVSEVAQLNSKLKEENIIDVCCGDWHSMALTSSGQLFAWGDNKYGQIGHDKDEIRKPVPVRLMGFNDEKIKSIACGSMHSMALTEKGDVYSWGFNKYGQLGIGNTKNQNHPIRIDIKTQDFASIEKIEMISCGQKHSFLLANNGNIFTFGKNYLKIVGSNKNQKTPILINQDCYKDIVSNNFYPFSVAINQRNEVYEIGQVGSKKLSSLIYTNKNHRPVNDAEDYYLKNKLITIRVKDFFDGNIHFQNNNNNNDQPGVFNNINQPEIMIEQVTNSSDGEPIGSDSNVYLPDCSDGQQIIADANIHLPDSSEEPQIVADAIVYSPDRREELITSDDNNQQNSNNQNLDNSSSFNQNEAPQEEMQPCQVSNADEQNDNLNIDSTVLNINGNNNIRRELLENVEVLTVVTGTNNVNLSSAIGNLANNLPSTSNFDLILNNENIISNENENIAGNARAINSTTPQNNMDENIVPSDVQETIENTSRKPLDTQFSYNGMYKHKFEEKEKLKKGGFGEVFKVKNRDDKQIYAVKKIPSEGEIYFQKFL